MSPAPAVAILCGRSPEERYSTHRGYVASVTAAGGFPILVPAGPDVDPCAVVEVVGRCAAVVATGGGDVDPELYGTTVTDSDIPLMELDRQRDHVEIVAVQHALSQGKRVLGVCRGAQLLAVIGGGTLVLDLVDTGLCGHWDEERQYQEVHTVTAEPGSTVASLLCSVRMVNSIHHQAIADPGQDLRATAWSDDGVIEAVEGCGVLGVQWHPERLAPTDARHLAPFHWVLGG